MPEKVFSQSEKRVISAMYQLDRWATAYEIAEWADGMSWNTTMATLRRLKTKKIVASKIINEKLHWKIIA